MWPFKRRRQHQADGYFDSLRRARMSRDTRQLVATAWAIRHDYPDLSGPELVRLVYWGVSGSRPAGGDE